MSDLSENDGHRILLQNAILKINEMQNKLIAAEEARHEPVAITGMACRFPGGANSPQEFWQLLKEGRDAIVEIPPERWPVDEYYDPDPAAAGKIATRWGGFLSQVDQFDAQFFGISPREAASMDPQQRLLLETTWEALEAAGEVPDQLAGSLTGVFVGLYSNDYEQLQFRSPATLGAYAGPGTSRNIAAGRLSYSLDLRGPSVALDTACSSSLLAVHLACQSLRARECHLALAAGVNLLLAPHFLIATSKMHMLAADGRCKTFDAAANGIVLSEGCGVVVLKRLSDALAAGDPILALIRGSAANQDGRSAALTAPNPLAQRDVIQQALSQAHLQPQDIGYIETHGTGTVLGDPIEYEALSSVFGSAPEAGPCYLGAVKTNIGHAGAASGMAGLIKAILVLRHKEIPPLLHLQTLNPAIHLDQSPFCIPTTCVPWEAPSQRYYAGVSSFGWSGTNVHVVLEEAPAAPAQESMHADEARTDEPPPLWLLPLSARSPHALRQFAHTCSSFLRQQPPQALPALSFTACLRRSHHPYRLCLLGPSPDALASQALTRAHASGELAPAGAPALLLVFAGQGCLWPGVARRLLRQEPVFAQQIEYLDALLTPRTGWSLLRLLAQTPLPESARQLEQTHVAQPVLFAVQVALARLLQHWGLRPAAVLGHSVGEIAAALIGGQVSEQEAAELVSERGRLMEAARGRGKLLAVGLARRELESLLDELEVEETEVGVACENAPRALVLWGTPGGLARVEQAVRGRQGQVRELPGAYPFHSPWLSEVQEPLRRRLAELHPQAGSVPFFSSLWGRQMEGQELTAEYWSRQVREPVRFAQAMQEVMRSFEQVAVVELGGRPVLQGALRQCLQEAGGRGRVWASLRGPQEGGEDEVDERACLLESVGGMYEQGLEPEWERVNRWASSPPPPVVAWPAYPWQRQRFWLEHHEPEFVQPDWTSWLYRPAWRLQQRAAQTGSKGQGMPTHWLLLSDEGGVAASLEQVWCQREIPVLRLRLPREEQDWAAWWRACWQQEEMQAWLASVRAAPQGLLAMAQLGSLDLERESREPQALLQRLYNGWQSLYMARQTLTRAAPGVRARLWLATRQAQAIGGEQPAGGDGECACWGAAWWGLGRVLALEQPDWWGGLCDLDGQASITEQVEALTQEWGEGESEEQVSWRSGQRFVFRVQRQPTRVEGTTTAWPVRAEGSYLLTGGPGSLGQHLGQWLVEAGARHLVLVNRSGEPGAASEIIADWRRQGVQVEVRACDVREREQVVSLLSCFGRQWPVLRGIVHAAGVSQPLRLGEMDWQNWKQVTGAKLLGGWWLSNLSQQQPVEWILACSSAASIWGVPGQGSYAAANAVLDQLAWAHQRTGCRMVSVNWGPWAAGGIASPQIQQRLERMGMLALPAREALAALAMYVRGDAQGKQVLITRIDWQRFAASYEARGERAILEEVRPERSEPGKDSGDEPARRSALALALEERDESERLRQVERVLSREVGEVLGRTEQQELGRTQGFFEAGMDSLLAVEVRQRLQAQVSQPLPATLVFDYPTLARLAQFLVQNGSGDRASTHPAAVSPERASTAMLEELEHISEEDAESMLHEELENLLKRL